MRAANYDDFGGPDVLRVAEMPEPPLGPDAILIRVRATSVNPVDCKIRQGHLRGAYPHHLPIIPGWDVAGVVEAVGPAVRTGIAVGHEVWGYVRRDDVAAGTAAELAAAPERTVSLKPSELSFEEAASVPLAGLTAYQALTEALRVTAGDRVLVHAASGGVGQFAVQIAVALGAEVIGTSSAQHAELVRGLGAAQVLDYTAGPISEQLGVVGGPVDAVLDLIGGAALSDAPQQVHDASRVASVQDPDTVASFGGRYVFVRPQREHLDALADLAARGQLRVTLARTFELADIAAAHHLAEQGGVGGKIAVRIDS